MKTKLLPTLQKSAGPKEDIQASVDELKAYIRKNVDEFKQSSKMSPELTDSLIGGAVGLGVGGLGSLLVNDWRLPLLTTLGGAGLGYNRENINQWLRDRELARDTAEGKVPTIDKPQVPQEYTPTNKNLVSGIGAAITGGAAVGGAKTYQDYTKEMGLRARLKDPLLPSGAHKALTNQLETGRIKSRRNALLTALAGAFGTTIATAPHVMSD